MPGVEHRQHKGLNNRAENSHQPTRRRERQMKRFKSARHVQRFVSIHDPIANLFHLRRDHVTASQYRAARSQSLRGLGRDRRRLGGRRPPHRSLRAALPSQSCPPARLSGLPIGLEPHVMSETPPSTDIIIGVDTHKHTHAAVAITGLGARLAEHDHQGRLAKAIGSSRPGRGAGNHPRLRHRGHRLVRRRSCPRPCATAATPFTRSAAPTAGCGANTARPIISMRRAPPAPCSAAKPPACPRPSTGRVEMIRHLKVARDTAVKGRNPGHADAEGHHRQRAGGPAREA